MVDPIPLEDLEEALGEPIADSDLNVPGLMHYPEEDHANDLYRHLTQRFGNTTPPTTLSVAGAGVNWRCTAKRGDSSCSITCFDEPGPQYYTAFKRSSQKLATGRTSSREDTLAAVDDWLQGHQVPFLHDRFPFVDQTKRALSVIGDTVVARVPQLLQSAPPQLEHDIADFYDLWFRAGDRSCQISYYRDEYTEAAFHWDECALFSFRVDDNAPLADVLRRWLCDRAMPSTMRTEFPWLSIGDLADHYEQGNRVEGEFIKSWDWMQRFYEDNWDDMQQFYGDRFSMREAVLTLLAQLRNAGYDRKLRAGQSLRSLIVSRSRRHGLREGQPRVCFSFREGVMDVHVFVGDRHEAEEIRGATIGLSAQVEAALRRLAEEPID